MAGEPPLPFEQRSWRAEWAAFKTYWNDTPRARLAGSLFVIALCLSLVSPLVELVVPGLDTVFDIIELVMVIIAGGVGCPLVTREIRAARARERPDSDHMVTGRQPHAQWTLPRIDDVVIHRGTRDQQGTTHAPTLSGYSAVHAAGRSDSAFVSAMYWTVVLSMAMYVSIGAIQGPDIAASPPLPAAMTVWWLFGAMVIVLVGHRSLRAALAAWFGSTVAVGVVFPFIPSARLRNVVLTRWQSIAIELGPGVVLSLVGVLWISIGSESLFTAGLLVLVASVPVATAAVLLNWRLLIAPVGSRVYIAPDGAMQRYVQIPTSPSIAARLEEHVLRASDWLKL
jgi:hypothetical protein